MSFDVPDDRRYLDSHEWAARQGDGGGDGDAGGDVTDGDVVRVGISDFAQDELGDVVFVELPSEGETVTAGESFGVVESIKAVSDVYAPVSGTVADVNDDLANAPEIVNEDPYGDGWMVAIELDDESEFEDLLSADDYADQIA